MTKPNIGFIGVGLMGHGMAKNIVEAGYPLIVMAHRKRDAVENLIGRGAREVGRQAAIWPTRPCHAPRKKPGTARWTRWLVHHPMCSNASNQ